MKHTRIAALMALVLCAVMLLASCGTANTKDPRNVKSLKFNQLVKSWSTPEAKTAAIEKVDLKGDIKNRSGSIYLLSSTEEKTLTVYNAKLGKVLFTLTDAKKFDDNDVRVNLSNYYFTVEDDADNKTTLYAGDGTEIASVPYSGATAIVNKDLIQFGSKIYRFGEKGDDAFTLKAVEGADPRVPVMLGTILDMNDNYYYTVSSRGASGKLNPVSVLMVYDRSLKLVNTYTPDPGANSVQAFVLNNGNVVFQYRYRLPADAKEYTACNNNGTEKYLFRTEIFNVKKGSVKEVDFPYVIGSIGNVSTLADEADGTITFAKGVSNLAFVYPIVDRRLGSTMDVMVLSVGDDLSVKGRLDAMVDLQAPGSIATPVNNDVLSFPLVDGTSLLTDKKGKEIGNIASFMVVRENYIRLNEAFYDFSLNTLYDCEANGFEVANLFDNFAILVKDNDEGMTEFYRWAPGSEPEKIIAADSNKGYQSLGDSNGYAIVDYADATNLKCSYYDAKGNLLLSTEKLDLIDLSSASPSNGALGYAIDAGMNKIYYRVYLPSNNFFY